MGGDAQDGVTTFPLDQPLTIVARWGSRPKDGIPIVWSVTEGDGHFKESGQYLGKTFYAVTQADGTSSVTLVLGGQEGVQSVTARVGDQPVEVTFRVTARVGYNAVVSDWYNPDAETAKQAWRMLPPNVSVISMGVVDWEFAFGPHWLVPSGDGTEPRMSEPGMRYLAAFKATGSYPYRCLLHLGEAGVVTVKPGQE